MLSGGVFWYYFGGLRKSEEAEVRGKWSLDARMAALSVVAVAVMVILGFWLERQKLSELYEPIGSVSRTCTC